MWATLPPAVLPLIGSQAFGQAWPV